ncbi:MAG: WYL domain-containing protein [Candidatus Competibacteraceae bacterium]|nr:WYL domain-containing protein [Candidatus Competibacteraceae bacterium]
MSYRATIRRYLIIIERVSQQPYPTLQQINDALQEHGLDVSARTLQRNLESIRDEFGINITYNRSRHEYRIEESNSLNQDTFLHFLQIFHLADLLGDAIHRSSSVLNYIKFQNIGLLQGIHWLKDLLHAVKEHRYITFTHKSFQSASEKRIRLRPYLIKEYMSRWYVIGKPDNSDSYRTYGIDRISALQVDSTRFKFQKNQDPSAFFDSVIGISDYSNLPEEVVLHFRPMQARYVKALPWHPSQQVLHEDEFGMQIQINVIINYELVLLILMHGNTVKVLEPDSLRNLIKKHLQSALKQYRS